METPDQSKVSSSSFLNKECFHCGNPTNKVYCSKCDHKLNNAAASARLNKLHQAQEKVGLPLHLLDSSLLPNDKSRLSDWSPGVPLVIFGPQGSGKSRLAAAMTVDRLMRTAMLMPHHVTNWWSSIKFTSASTIIGGIRADLIVGDGQGMERYTRPSFMVIDDFGFDNPTDWVNQTWMSLIDIRNGKRATTVICTQFNSSDIERMYGSVISARLKKFHKITIRGKQ